MNGNKKRYQSCGNSAASRAISSYQDWSPLTPSQRRNVITVVSLLLTPSFWAMGMLRANASIFFPRDRDSVGFRLLTESQGNMLKTSQWWDKVWNSMLTGVDNSFSNDALLNFIMPLLLIIMLLFVAKAGKHYLQGDFLGGINSSVIPVIILVLFIFSYGFASKMVARGFRLLSIRSTDMMLSAQITEVNFKEAIEDKLFDLEMQQEIREVAQYCSTLPAPTLKAEPEKDLAPATSVSPLETRTQDSLQCMETLVGEITKKLEEMKAECPHCTTAQEYAQRAKSDLEKIAERVGYFLASDEPLLDLLYAPFNAAGSLVADKLQIDGPLMAQYWFVSSQEMALYLAALLAVVMVLYASLPLPGRIGVALTYFTAFVIIVLVRVAYLLLLGMGASFLSDNPPAEGAEYWANFMGYVAPIVASGAVVGGVIAAVNAWSGSMITTIGVGVGVVSAGVSSAVGAIHQKRYRDR